MTLGRPPTRDELAASLGVPQSELDALKVDVHRAVMVSIDADTGGDRASLDLPDTGDSPERAMLRRERARHLEDAIRALPDRLDEVIERNFFGDESLTKIAEDLGVTLSRVSQMRARALILLHAAMREVWEGAAVRPTAGCAPATSSGPTWTRSPAVAARRRRGPRAGPVCRAAAAARGGALRPAQPGRRAWQTPGTSRAPTTTARPA